MKADDVRAMRSRASGAPQGALADGVRADEVRGHSRTHSLPLGRASQGDASGTTFHAKNEEVI